jgi:hypothetical protein
VRFVEAPSAISAIIPVYNCATCLKRAIDSALLQNPRPLEVIVVDDGSTDETPQVAASFGERITLVRQPNAGPAAARERGVRIAKGKYIATLDADDYWLPGFFESCQRFLDGVPDAVAVSVGLRFRHIARPDSTFPDPRNPVHRELNVPFIINSFFSFWGKFDHVRPGSAVLRRSIVEHAGFQVSGLRTSEDLEYWAYLATFGKWGFIPQVLWVSDSEAVSARTGWLRKFRIRRRMCPTIEEWEKRVVPRLRVDEWPGFRMVRGRVAAGFAQSHILAGRSHVARQIARTYGTEMPDSWSSRALRMGDRMPWPAWSAACLLVRLREYQKAMAMTLRVRLDKRISVSSSDRNSPKWSTGACHPQG